MGKDYTIEERVIQRAMETFPLIPELVEFSTPVVSFGYPVQAKVATLGINPSNNEFQIGNGNKSLLPKSEKRLVDTASLNLNSPVSLNREEAVAVVKGCYSYFDPEGKPYKWFDKLENHVLRPIGYSYKDRTACHLDLVQWATDPVWQDAKMSETSRRLLLDGDKEFLEFQLKSYDFEYVFLNGGTVVEQVGLLNLFSLEKVGEVRFNSKGTMSDIVYGKMGDKIFVGWGINIGYGATYKGGLIDLENWLVKNLRKLG